MRVNRKTECRVVGIDGLDGIIEREVPQPVHSSGGARSARKDGSRGVILGSTSHLRVTLETTDAKLASRRSIVPGVTRANFENGEVEFSDTVRSR